MSVIGKSVRDTTPASSAQPTYLVDMDTGLPASLGGGLSNAQYTAVAGTAAAAAWGGTGNGTGISILKALYNQNVQIISLLNDIKTNTAPTP